MAIDARRVVEAAVEAAIRELAPPPAKPKKRRLPRGRALLLGAGVVTAGRVATGSRGRKMFGHLRQRVADSDWYRDRDLDDATEPDEEIEPEDKQEELDADAADEDLEEEYAEDPEEEEPAAPRAPRARSRRRG